MNHIIADNSVQVMRDYLHSKLASTYEDRELQNIVAALFDAFKHWSRSEMILQKNERLSESEMLRFHFAAKKLAAGEPLQYVLGKAWFAGREFHVNPTVLIPRPETEELVALVLKNTIRKDASILDVGTGSGCIAITLKCEMPDAKMTAIDISTAAIITAQENATQHRVSITFEKLDFLNHAPRQSFDIVVSNPPYIALEEIQNMRAQVINHEPHLALFTENDPLIFYKRLITLAPTILNKEGVVYCEIHEDKKDDLERLLLENHINVYQFHQDLQGKNRMLEFRL